MILSTLPPDRQAALAAECQLRLARHAERQRDDAVPPLNPIDFWCAAWWSCVEAMENPRPVEAVERDLALMRARVAGLTT
jgi:hypothetical protein